MLMTVLKGELATRQSITLIGLFKQMKQFLTDNAMVFQNLEQVNLKLFEHDRKFETVFRQLEDNREKKGRSFFRGQMYDAFSFISKLVAKADKTIVLIDGYVDTGTLDLLSKKKEGGSVLLVTSRKGYKLTDKEVNDFINQYGDLKIGFSEEFHDRFMILDDKFLYHIGASIKDAGKKAFEISIIDDEKQLTELSGRI